LHKPKPHGAVLAWFEALEDTQMHLSAVTIGEIQAGIELTREQDAPKAQEIEAWLEMVAEQLGRTHPDRVPAAVRTGHEPRGVPVGMAQTTRAGQLLPKRLERIAHDRAHQAQECSKAPLDHRRLLDAGYAVVMS
jgi:hypothetical protein